MKTLLKTIASALFALTILAGMAGAHEIWGPPLVTANGAGRFSYDIILTISNPIEFGHLEIDGSDNTDVESIVMDGFCLSVQEAGTFLIPIEGKLVDLDKEGSVFFEQYMCDGWLGQVTTTISAPVVDVETTTWSTIKSLYR